VAGAGPAAGVRVRAPPPHASAEAPISFQLSPPLNDRRCKLKLVFIRPPSRVARLAAAPAPKHSHL